MVHKLQMYNSINFHKSIDLYCHHSISVAEKFQYPRKLCCLPSSQYPSPILNHSFVCVFFFFTAPQNMEFPGQGSDPSCSCNLSQS